MSFQNLFFIGACIFGLMHNAESKRRFYPFELPPSEECSHIFDEMCQTAKIYCENQLDLREELVCNQNLFHVSQFRIDLFYKNSMMNNEFIDINPNVINQIYSIDISNNELVDIPPLQEMQNLRSLNFSRNRITQAKLSNNYGLPSLTSLDYSYNTISTIVVFNYELIFNDLIHLNLSHNYLTVITDSVFESFKKMEDLDLSYNYIDILSILTFEGLRNLVNLNLSNNRITDINSSLVRFKKLQELDLSHNMLSTIMSTDFNKLTDIRSLNLSSNSIVNVEFNVFDNMVHLNTLSINENRIPSLNIDLKNTNIQAIDLSKNNLTSLPINIFMGKSLTIFHIEQNSLEILMEGTFEGLTFVTHLDLSEQKLYTLENNTFIGLHGLKTLLLNKNKLTFLPPLCFNGLRNLVLLNLSENHLSKVDFSFNDLVALNILLLNNNFIAEFVSETFKAKTILQLDVSYNNLTNLNQTGFKNLNSVVSFHVHHNPLSGELTMNSFIGFTSLPKLDISGTSLVALRNGSIQGMTHLTYLNISHSKIGEVEFNTFANSSAIELIDLSFNNLTGFHVNTQDLPNLNTLLLNNNLIVTIFSSYFKNLISLSEVYLSYNKIETVYPNVFVDQSGLRFLDMSYNPSLRFDFNQIKDAGSLAILILSGINQSITFEKFVNATIDKLEMKYCDVRNVSTLGLSWLPRLTSLTLSRNRVARLDVGAFANLTNLRTLDLSYNNITFIQPGVFKDNSALSILNISHNLLIAIPFGIFNGLKYINTIDFSYNYVRDLENEKFYKLDTLSVIIADNNKIKSLKSSFMGHTSLRELSIGGNAIPCIELVEFEKFAKLGSIELTALNKDEVGIENVNGISCGSNNENFNIKSLDRANIDLNENHDVEKILLSMRDILSNFSIANSIGNNYDQSNKNFTNSIQKSHEVIIDILTNSSSLINNENIRTNSLLVKNINEIANVSKYLESILNVLNKAPNVDRLPNVPKPNATLENIISYYVNDLKEELHRYIAKNKDMMSNLNNEVAYLRNKLNESNRNELLMTYKQHDNASSFHNALVKEKDDTKSFVFMEICLSLILVILVGYILYKLYKSKLHIPTGRSYSTRNLPEEMDNSNL